MRLTYRVEQFVKKISSPIIVKIGNEEMHFKNGSELAEYKFDSSCVITDLSAKESTVVITLAENENINDTNWVGEIQEGFF